MKSFFQNKGVGYYVSFVVGVIALVAAIIYAVVYGGYRSNNNEGVMSWAAFAMLLVCFALPILGGLFKLEKFAPYGVFAAGLLALVFYIYKIYYHASVLFAGIELQDNKSSFFFISGMMVVVFVLTIVAFFLPQNKEAK
ncbi:MAG: hypothetical protein II467_01140 [Bacilli bacterium]|nr:hypothetical protein [Bacilli bacterium]MBQ4254486.1 hypothetical protein [Bacilli bacterium]